MKRFPGKSRRAFFRGMSKMAVIDLVLKSKYFRRRGWKIEEDSIIKRLVPHCIQYARDLKAHRVIF